MRRWLRTGRHQRGRRAALVRRDDPLAALVAENERRLDAQDAKLGALFVAMGDACRAAGLPAPDPVPAPLLRLVAGKRRGA